MPSRVRLRTSRCSRTGREQRYTTRRVLTQTNEGKNETETTACAQRDEACGRQDRTQARSRKMADSPLLCLSRPWKMQRQCRKSLRRRQKGRKKNTRREAVSGEQRRRGEAGVKDDRTTTFVQMRLGSCTTDTVCAHAYVCAVSRYAERKSTIHDTHTQIEGESQNAEKLGSPHSPVTKRSRWSK